MDVGLAQIFVLMVSMSAVQSQIRKGPVNALKRAGDSVTHECVTSSNNCHQVDWQKVEGKQSPKLVYRNGKGMLNSDVYPTTRYSVNENDGCSLTITQLNTNDSGKFMCIQSVGDKEETRTSILVVINVTESCMSNVTSIELTEGDGYSLWSVIQVPPKSVEPSDVSLFFHNKIVDETETTDKNQTHTVTTTLTGIMTKKNITQRGCRASFPPNTEANYDDTTAFLDVCSTQQLTVSYPVENFAISPSGPYYKGMTVHCTADGYPSPTIRWTHLKSGGVVNGSALVIKGDVGDQYTCTAMNTVKGKAASQSKTIEVSSDPSCATGCIFGFAMLVCGVLIIVAVVVYFAGWQCGFWVISLCCIPLVIYWNKCICCKRCICEIKDTEKNDERANVRLTNSTSSAPDKPPRLSENPVKPEPV